MRNFGLVAVLVLLVLVLRKHFLTDADQISIARRPDEGRGRAFRGAPVPGSSVISP